MTLERAAKIVGGSPALSRYLNVSAALLALWMTGAQPPPTDAFLKAVDLVEAEVVASLRKKDG
ncbi:MAG TPA: hypothetical protein VG873_03340 [Burkholderiales bacterium]|nr:hypothetical protein [Burkholderiales bacterium]